jgi:hypothetical protein
LREAITLAQLNPSAHAPCTSTTVVPLKSIVSLLDVCVK